MTKLKQEDFYKGFRVNYDEKTLEIFITNPGDTVSLMAEWAKSFADFETVNVCLSGGIDSQFVLSVLRALNKNINIYIFSFTWDDCVINSPDVTHAKRYCEKFGLKYTDLDIDFKNFLHTGNHLNVCKKYKATSPQIALQLKMLDYIPDTHIPTFLGGDVPMFEFNRDTKRSSVAGYVYQPFLTNAFNNYGTINNRIVIKDLFRINPITNYLGFKQMVDTTIKHKIAVPYNIKGSGTTQQIRKLFYIDLGTDIVSPLLKNTGFELLKQHLAIESGIYNQFDLLYRAPLENTLRQESWFNFTKGYAVKTKTSVLQELLTQHETFCQNTDDIEFCEGYNFIL